MFTLLIEMNLSSLQTNGIVISNDIVNNIAKVLFSELANSASLTLTRVLV